MSLYFGVLKMLISRTGVDGGFLDEFSSKLTRPLRTRMRSLSGSWPASSWESMSLSRALWRPTSSRTLRRFPTESKSAEA